MGSDKHGEDLKAVSEQIADLCAEAEEFDRLLATLGDGDWGRATRFKGWTVNDIVQHLHMGDCMGFASASDPAGFQALLADIQTLRASGLTRVEETRERLGNPTGARLRKLWRERLTALAEALAAKGPGERLKWSGPDMGVRMFSTARQMEIWAHGQAIYDMLGRERPAASPRIRNIAELGVRTFAWTYRNRGLAVPPIPPYIRLGGPSGETWDWNTPSTDNAVTGDAFQFCQVAAQVRNVADTGLSVVGEVARYWLSIAQCFAGPPERPPPAGTRKKMDTRL